MSAAKAAPKPAAETAETAETVTALLAALLNDLTFEVEGLADLSARAEWAEATAWEASRSDARRAELCALTQHLCSENLEWVASTSHKLLAIRNRIAAACGGRVLTAADIGLPGHPVPD